VKDQPIASFQPKPAAPAEPPRINFPKLTQPGKPSLKFSTGTIPGKAESTISSGSYTQDILSQATAQKMHPDEVERQVNEFTIANHGKAPEIDHQQFKAYKESWWREQAQNKMRQLMVAGVPEPQAQVMAARIASDEMKGFYPEGAGSLVNYGPEERHRVMLNAGLKGLQMRVGALLDAAKPGTINEIQPGIIRNYVMEALPDASPEEINQALNQMTELAAQRFAPIFQQGGIPQGPAMMASMMAAAQLSGHIPQGWQQMVMGNPGALGITDPDVASKVASGEINLFAPNGLKNGLIQIGAEKLAGKQAEKRYERSLATLQTPEAVEAFGQQGAQPAPGQPQPMQAAAPQQTPGQLDRSIQAQKLEQEANIRADVEKQHKVAPENEFKQLRAMDDMYVKGTRLLQLGQGAPGKPGLIERYGNTFGTLFELMNYVKSGTGSMDPDLKEYVNTLSGLFNIEKKEFTGTATSLNERKDLVAWIPDKSTNVRDALQSVGILLKQLGTEMGRDIEMVKKNYPGTDLSALNYQRIQDARMARKQGQQPPAMAQPQPPAISPPPPPPMPQQPAQALPQSAPQAELPPIEQQVERAKAENPAERGPKVGPNKPVDTAKASATVPQAKQEALTWQDKKMLNQAMRDYAAGKVDDKALEMAVAKVLGQGNAKLEGKALNEAVKTWTEALKHGARGRSLARGK
jgi:hypothetical protein